MTKVIDYVNTELTIREAMIDHVKRYPDKKSRPGHILWDACKIKTFDYWDVLPNSLVQAEIIYSDPKYDQGFDMALDGWFELEGGEKVSTLRTWKDDRYKDIVKYPFFSKDGRLCVWNVYRMLYGDGHVVEEKWTENAGFWVEEVGANERVYHCSPGGVTAPDFNLFLFRIQVTGEVK